MTTAGQSSPRASVNIVFRVIWFPALVFIAYVLLALILGVTRGLPGSDMVFHLLLGGFAIAFGVSEGLLAAEHANLGHLVPAVRHTLTFTLTATAAMFWEFAEFTVDSIFATRFQVDVPDTMSDLALGMVGGCILIVIRMRRRHAERDRR